ncbi:Protein BATH-47 [Aphelenchoides avenae]|nr:Protein BATH-47 [Aphelenchus avenae]
MVCGINWKLEVERRQKTVALDGKKTTTSRIAAKILYTVNDAQKSIRVKAKCRIRVRHATANDLKAERTDELSFDPKTDDAELERKFYGHDWLAGIETQILHDSDGYLVYDTLRVLCDIDAQAIGTAMADGPRRKRPYEERYEDVTLVMGGKRVRANKGILAVHCEFFAAAFYGERSGRKEEKRELTDVDPNDFEKFKAVIYPPQKALDEDNIYAVVSLAHRFGAKSLLEKCEDFMLGHLGAADAFKGLSVYAGLDDLKSKFLTAMSNEELEAWLTSEGIRELTKDDITLVVLEYKSRHVKP